MPQGSPAPGEFYRHFKDKLYQVREIAYHSETGERMVVYQAMYGDYRAYVRPYDMFISEVDHVKYPDVVQRFRFQYLADSESLTDENAEFPADEDNEESCGDESPSAEDNPQEESANPLLIAYMDAGSFLEKFELFSRMRPKMTHKLLDELAVVSDLVIPQGELDERYEEMKRCLLTRMKYERER